MKKILLLTLLFNTMMLLGSEDRVKDIQVKRSKIVMTSNKTYTYRGEIDIEMKTEEKKVNFLLNRINPNIELMNVKVNRNPGPVYEVQTTSGDKMKFKITFDYRLKNNLITGLKKEKIDFFELKGIGGLRGSKIISSTVENLSEATVKISATEMNFGKVNISKARQSGAQSQKNSNISIDYSLDRRINDSNITFIYPKEVYLTNKETGNQIKVDLKDNLKNIRENIGEKIKVSLPIISRSSNYNFLISGNIDSEEFKNKKVGDYSGTAKLRVYYDFISSEPEEDMYERVIRR